MNKQVTHTLIGLLLVIILIACGAKNDISNSSSITTQTPSGSLVPVNFVSIPLGADVTVDGKPLGKATVNTALFPGTYLVEFHMEGFQDASQEIVVKEGHNMWFSQVLEPQDRSVLMQITEGEPRYLEWDMKLERLYFRIPYYGLPENKPPDTYFFLNLKTGEVSANQPFTPSLWLEDAQLRRQLGIVDADPESIFNTAYLSPSGRYIAYVVSAEFPRLMFYDTQQQLTFETDVLLPEHSPMSDPAYRPRWSPDETAVLIERDWVGRGCNTVLFRGDKVETVSCSNFSEFIVGQPDQFLSGGDIVSPPSDNANVLVWIVADGVPSIWIANIEAFVGESIPVENPLDAAFFADGQTVYIAHKGGISRTTVDAPDQIELVTDMMASWNLRRAYFSPNASYVLLEATAGDSSSYWVYKIPPPE